MSPRRVLYQQQYLLVEDIILKKNIFINLIINDHPALVEFILIQEFMAIRPDMQINIFNATDEMLIRPVTFRDQVV
jgi:hypothetical protein